MRAADRLLAAVRRRLRIADAAWALGRLALPVGLLLAAGFIVAVRRFDAPEDILWLVALPVPVVLSWALLRRHPWRQIARRVDAHYATGDEIGNALELRRGAPRDDARASAIVELLVASAEARARTLDPRPVVPLSVPAPRWWDGVALLLLGAAMLVPPPDPPLSFVDPVPIVIQATPGPQPVPVDLALAGPLRDNLRDLAKGGQDTPAELAAQMLEVLDQLEKGEIDRAAALERLQELEELLAQAEERWEAELEEDPTTLAEALAELAAELEQFEITEDAAEALAKGQGDEAEAALDEAAEKAEADPKAGEEMDAALAKAEKQLEKAADKESQTAKDLDEAERRLRKEEKKKPTDPKEKEEHERRLKKMKEDVEKLRRQQQREEAAKRKLDELRRNAKDARDKSKSASERRKSLEKLGRGMKQASRTAQGSKRLGQARDGMEESKSAVRRAGQEGEGQKRRRQQFKRFSKAAKGKDGKDGQGKDGQSKNKGKGKSTLLVEGELGDGDPDQMMQMEGEGQGEGQGEGEGEGEGQGEGQGEGEGQGQGERDGPASQGDGIGEGSAEPLGDDATGLRSNAKNVRVNAKQGKGVSRAEVIRDASQQGFAAETYRDVYQDYRGHAQSAIDNEALPAAQRRRVKRYYQLIMPRE